MGAPLFCSPPPGSRSNKIHQGQLHPLCATFDEQFETSGKLDWTGLDAHRICRFVESELTKLSFNCRAQPVTAVRSFLRFLQSEGAIRSNLAHAIPPVRTWCHADIPRHLKPEQVQRLIAVCLEENVATRRDRAMVP